MTDRKIDKKKKSSGIKTFPVPYFSEEIEENTEITTNKITNSSKQEIISQAIKLQLQGNTLQAKRYYQSLINQGLNDYIVFSNYGAILKDHGKLKEAEIFYRKAIEIKPDVAILYSNLGVILKDLGKSKEAESSQRKAIELNPNLAIAYSNLSNILCDRGKLKEAEFLQRKSIKLNPKLHNSYYNLGNILRDIGNSEEAEKLYRKAIILKPDFTDAYCNLGNLLSEVGKLNEAKDLFLKCIDLDPKSIHHLSNLITTLSKLCMWDELENYSSSINRLGIEGKSIEPMRLMYLEDNPLNDLKRAKKFNLEHRTKTFENIIYPKNKQIRIGYFSSDFRNHPISHLLSRVIELHDNSRFRIYAYSLNKVNDEYTNRVRKAVFCFREISNLSDIEIVELARNDQIDIAVDLNGYTQYNRMKIFSYRVAPIQINYLGYTGTLGSDYFDYILADKVIIPEENKKFYSEKVLYLPNSSIPHDDQRFISYNKYNREELGLPSDGFIFTCFNSIQKITKNEFKIWMRLLHKVEKSVIWLIKPHKVAMENIYSYATKYGIEKEKIIFADRMKLDDHLSRHSCADLFLDTFNFNAVTTANFSLSAGLPLITTQGKSHSSRMASSILKACDLNELVTQNHLGYENLAYELATKKEKLNRIKEKLKNKKDLSFFNSYKFVKDLETIYTEIVDYN